MTVPGILGMIEGKIIPYNTQSTFDNSQSYSKIGVYTFIVNIPSATSWTVIAEYIPTISMPGHQTVKSSATVSGGIVLNYAQRL